MRKVAGTTDLQLQLRWRDEFDYYLDVFDEGFFERDSSNNLTSHKLYLHTKDKVGITADCKVTIKGKKAVLDYIGLNKGTDIQEGILTILFSDGSRHFVERVDWKPKSKKEPDEDVAETNWTIPDDVLEGKQRNKEIQLLSRNASLMEVRKRKDGYCCKACGYKVKVGKKYIVDCHHASMVSKGQRVTNIDDLLTLCPNCHRIAHTKNPPLDLQEIRGELKKAGVQVVVRK